MWGQKCGEIGSSFFPNDNVYPHTAAIIQQFFGQKRGGIVESPSIFKPPLLFRLPKLKIGAERWPLYFDRRHSEICNPEIKSVPNFWLRASYEMARRSHQRVYSSVRRLFRINITYLNFLHFFTVFAGQSQNLPNTPCIFIYRLWWLYSIQRENAEGCG